MNKNKGSIIGNVRFYIWKKERKMDKQEKVRENKARRQAWRQGLIIRKSRARNWSYDNQQGYMIMDFYRNLLRKGSNFDLTLEQVEECLKKK
jgi:hypothetical protein